MNPDATRNAVRTDCPAILFLSSAMPSVNEIKIGRTLGALIATSIEINAVRYTLISITLYFRSMMPNNQ
jgi:hypothetical protein